MITTVNCIKNNCIEVRKQLSIRSICHNVYTISTEKIALFANLSINDVWSAQYQIYDKAKDWTNNLVETIQGPPAGWGRRMHKE